MAKLRNEFTVQSFIATADLTGKEGYGVALDTSNANQVVIANAQTTKTIGILYEEGVAGQRVSVIAPQEGTATVVYGGTVAIGDWLTVDSAGKFIATTTDKDLVLARAKEAGATGESHEAILAYFTLSI